MARGGKREGAGRRKGTTGIKSTKTRERIAVAERAIASGVTPLDYMLSILRDESNDKTERFAAAKECAPYIHPRLSSVEANVKVSEHEDNLRRLRDAAMVTATQDHEQIH